jgi:hypothetical protein
MPITRKQFELGVDAATEEWMCNIQGFLAAHQDQAYTLLEVAKELNVVPEGATRLEVLSISSEITGSTAEERWNQIAARRRSRAAEEVLIQAENRGEADRRRGLLLDCHLTAV